MLSPCSFLSFEPLPSSGSFPNILRLIKTNKQPQKNTQKILTSIAPRSLWHMFYLDCACTPFSFFWHRFCRADSCFYRARLWKPSQLKAFDWVGWKYSLFNLLMSLLCQTCGDLSKIVLILAELCLIKSRLIKYPFCSMLLLLSPHEPIKIS